MAEMTETTETAEMRKTAETAEMRKTAEMAETEDNRCRLGYPASRLGYPASRLGTLLASSGTQARSYSHPSRFTTQMPEPIRDLITRASSTSRGPSHPRFGYPSPLSSGYPSPLNISVREMCRAISPTRAEYTRKLPNYPRRSHQRISKDQLKSGKLSKIPKNKEIILIRDILSRLQDKWKSSENIAGEFGAVSGDYFGILLLQEGRTRSRKKTMTEDDRQIPPTDITDDEETEENIRWAEESERERELGEIRASLARAEADMKLVKSLMPSVSSSAPNIVRILEESRNTPFTRRISEATISDPGKLKIDYFNGMTDPKGHIKSFMIYVARARFKPGEKDAGQCLLFVEHLKGPALDWFSRLERNSVDSFDKLSTLFLKQYSVLIDPGTSDADLWSLSQQPNEPLGDFLATFKSTLAKFEGITDVAALSALRKALWYKSELRKELNLSKPTTIRDALHRASDFVAHEEEMELIHLEVEAEDGDGAESHSRGLGTNHRVTIKNTANITRFLGTTPLVVEASERSGKLGSNITLKDLEPEPAQPEQTNTVRDPRPRNTEAPKKTLENPDEDRDGTRQKVLTIMAGSPYCPDTVAAIKAYQRRAEAPSNWSRPFDRPNDTVTFEKSETNGLDMPHNDPLVITLAVGDHDVSRVLIDTGSTIDVIFRETLRQMNIDMSQVTLTPRQVLGFSGETLMILRTIQLPVQAGGIEEAREEKKPTSDPVISISLDDKRPERCVEIGCDLTEEIKAELISSLKENIDTFAWSAEDLPGSFDEVELRELRVSSMEAARSRVGGGEKAVKRGRRVSVTCLDRARRVMTGVECEDQLGHGHSRPGAPRGAGPVKSLSGRSETCLHSSGHNFRLAR
ncbi:Retrotransposon gag domain [Arabidopsis suecica]|uniref:Retrotransposon gag domain n=1 Tax=Arabidopsis suecica TaxID=45249 RepID=A0A8T1ZCS0_ARASU|nr:Retrotransposon gag domain [Arabidopsis suecica]